MGGGGRKRERESEREREREIERIGRGKGGGRGATCYALMFREQHAAQVVTVQAIYPFEISGAVFHVQGATCGTPRQIPKKG